MATTTAVRNLVAEGYGVTAGTGAGVFLVIRPDGEVYQTNALAQTCSCKAGQNGRVCCHRTQLQDLLRDGARRLLAECKAVENSDPLLGATLLDEVDALVAQWQAVRAARPTEAAPVQAESATRLGRMGSAAAYHANPARWAVWGKKRSTGAWICLGGQYRSEAQAEHVRETVFAASASYAQTSVRPARQQNVGVAA